MNPGTLASFKFKRIEKGLVVTITMSIPFRFKDRVTELSSIFKDEQNPPLERALFSIEFVLRHKNIVTHRSSSARTLNFLQYHSVDVVAVLLAILLLLALVIKKLIGSLIRRIVKFGDYDGQKPLKRKVA
jgi:hypothetical protein